MDDIFGIVISKEVLTAIDAQRARCAACGRRSRSLRFGATNFNECRASILPLPYSRIDCDEPERYDMARAALLVLQ